MPTVSTTTSPPTARQAEIHEFMLDYQRRNGLPPTVREIGLAFDIRSTNGVTCHLKAMAKKGWIDKREGPNGRHLARSWRAIDPTRPECCPHCRRPYEP